MSRSGVARTDLRSLLTLATATFVMVSAEMLPTAVLPQVAADLGVAPARIGLLVSAWALTVVVASLPLVRVTARWGRRDVVVVAMAALAVSAALTAASGTYPQVMAARLVGAAACGLLWAAVNAHTADLVAPERLARAVAVVLGGATLGTVVGVPLAGLVAAGAGWRVAFAGLAVLGAGVAVAVRLAVAPGGPPRDATPGDVPDAAARRAALTGVLTVASLAGLVLVGHFAAWTFVTRLLAAPAAALPGGTPTLLLVFGVASAAGLALVGRVPAGGVPAALAASGVLTAVTVGALAVATGHAGAALVVVVLWGVASGALAPLAQTQIMARAGEELRTTAGALVPVLLNLGIAVGAAAGSAVVAARGVDALPLPAAAVVAAGAAGLVAAWRHLDRAPARHGAAPPEGAAPALCGAGVRRTSG